MPVDKRVSLFNKRKVVILVMIGVLSEAQVSKLRGQESVLKDE